MTILTPRPAGTTRDIIRLDRLTDQQRAELKDWINRLWRSRTPIATYPGHVDVCLVFLLEMLEENGQIERYSRTWSHLCRRIELYGYTITGDWARAYLEAFDALKPYFTPDSSGHA